MMRRRSLGCALICGVLGGVGTPPLVSMLTTSARPQVFVRRCAAITGHPVSGRGDCDVPQIDLGDPLGRLGALNVGCALVRIAICPLSTARAASAPASTAVFRLHGACHECYSAATKLIGNA